MKLTKKILSIVLAMSLMLSVCSTLCFAAAEAELTALPTSPEYKGHWYVYMQAHNSIKTNGDWRKPTSHSRGIESSNSNTHIGFTETGGAHFLNAANSTTRCTTDGFDKTYGPRILFEKIDGTESSDIAASATSGYLVIHNNGVLVKVADNGNGVADSNVVSAFGIGALYDGATAGGSTAITAQAVVGTKDGSNGAMTLWIWNNSDNGRRELPVDYWVKAGEKFDYKMIINLDKNTYDLYLNNNAVALDIPARDEDVEALFIYALGPNQGDTEFGATWCYPVAEDWARQYRQAAIERSLNKTFANADDNLMLFYTYGVSDIANKFYADSSVLRRFYCDNVSNFQLRQTGAGVSSYMKVFMNSNDMTLYNYDNLELLFATNPVVDAAAGKISGEFIAAGGKASKPYVISAFYTESDGFRTLESFDITQSTSYGKYEATLDFENAPVGSTPTFMIWSGLNKIMPLFTPSVLPAIEDAE